MRRFPSQDISLFVLVAGVTAAFVWVLLPFYGALLWAVVLAMLFNPLQGWLVSLTGGQRNLSAAISLLACICIIVIPGSLLLAALAHDANSFFQRISDREFDPAAILERLHGALPDPVSRLIGDFDSLKERFSSEVADVAGAIASRLTAIGQGTARFFISVGVMLYVLFFLFRDGKRLAATLRRVSPLSELHTNRLLEQFSRVVHATVKGNFIIAAIQGTLGGIAFWILGIEGAPLWGALMAAVSLLPTFGAALAWAPVAAWLLLAGEYVRGVILLAVGVLVISMIDNFLRPVLVGRGAGIPDYVVLVSTVGGLALFGVHGLVIGPLVAALFLAAWSLLDERRESGWTR